jgi:NAD(P)-dependent dehydrogenase (short-subunit alcohol dehydrogenase family)
VRFARLGANVIVNGRTVSAAAESVAAECREFGVAAMVAAGDMADPRAVDDVVSSAERGIGPIDVTVNCVGVRLHQPFAEITPESWDTTLRTNLTASFHLAQRVTPGMVERRWGRVIHVAGGDGFAGWPNRAHNIAAKAGLHGLTKALALELGPFGVTVNTVAPGIFATTRDPEQYPGWSEDEMAKLTVVGRIGRPEEFAAACTYVASEEAGYLTGQVLHINGGQFMH